MKLQFGTRIANLYDLGYLLTDIQQLIAFTGLLEEGDMAAVEKYFGDKAKGFNRYVKVIEDSGRESRVTDASAGSVVLTVAGSFAATVVGAIVAAKVSHELAKEEVELKLEIDPEDAKLREHLDAYSRGDYGKGTKALDNLFDVLSRHDYETTVLSENSIRVERVTDRYMTRMVKTIKRSVKG